jgi:hypothetical protein
MNADWGGVGRGLLFFATDTGTISQWNGPFGWSDVSSIFFGPSFKLFANKIQLATGTAAGPIVTIPANKLKLGSVFDIECPFYAGANSNSYTFDIAISGLTGFFTSALILNAPFEAGDHRFHCTVRDSNILDVSCNFGISNQARITKDIFPGGTIDPLSPTVIAVSSASNVAMSDTIVLGPLTVVVWP